MSKIPDDPKEFFNYFQNQINEYDEALKDDEEFCSKDIEATFDYLKKIEEKFQKKIQEYRIKLEQLRIQNSQVSQRNRDEFVQQTQIIRQFYDNQKYSQAKEKLQDYAKKFQNRVQIIQQIPRCSITDNAIEELFSEKKSSPVQAANIVHSTAVNESKQQQKDDSDDERYLTEKEKQRRRKKIEDERFDDNDNSLESDNVNGTQEKSSFGKLSKTIINETTIISNYSSSQSAPPPPRRYNISNRLAPKSTSVNPPCLPRILNTSPLTVLPKTADLSPNPTLSLNPVCHYQHESNKYLLMTCNYNYIVLFRSYGHKWYFGAIERRSHTPLTFDWHDGSIVSMGFLRNDEIYIFTELSVTTYSISKRAPTNNRMLKQGTNENYDVNQHQRGIGTVFGDSMYHMYLNRSSHWTVSKFLLNPYKSDGDYDLTLLYPNVRQFIHLCITKGTWNFLVQMDDYTYAVVYCYPTDFRLNQPRKEIVLENARKPLTIYSAYNEFLKCDLFFINDPLGDTLHVITLNSYFYSYSIKAHAICYAEENNELMILTDNSISSINLNKHNFVLTTDN